MFLVEGIPTIVLGVLLPFLLTDRPQQARWLTPEQRQWLAAQVEPPSPGDTAAHSAPAAALRALADLRVLALSFVAFGILYGFYGVSFFLPQIVAGLSAEVGRKLSLVQVGLVTAVPFTVAIIVLAFATRASDRTGERVRYIAGGLVLAVVGILVAAFAPSPWPMIVGLSALVAGVLSANVILWSLPPNFLHGAALATGIAVINSCGNLSGFLGPFLGGYLKGATGSFQAPMLLVSGVLLAAVALLLAMRRSFLPATPVAAVSPMPTSAMDPTRPRSAS